MDMTCTNFVVHLLLQRLDRLLAGAGLEVLTSRSALGGLLTVIEATPSAE